MTAVDWWNKPTTEVRPAWVDRKMLPPRPTKTQVFWCPFRGYESCHHSPLAIPHYSRLLVTTLLVNGVKDSEIPVLLINISTTWYLCGHVLPFCQLKLLRHADMCCLLLVKQLHASGYDYRDYNSWKESCVFKMKNKNKSFRGSSGVVKDQDCIFSPLKPSWQTLLSRCSTHGNVLSSQYGNH